jgi:putative restriction endonuclease
MRAYVAVTDGDWFRFLRALPGVDEVNFWQPGGQRGFSAVGVGQPFLFKLHYPEHAIVGGGFLRHSSILPCSLAWDAFGKKNGAPSFAEMRRRIERYRRVPPDPHAEYNIGCILLADPFFFDDRDWIRPPEDFARTIVQGKTYDLTSSAGQTLWASVIARLKARHPDDPQVSEVGPEMFGEPALVRPRLGQGTFRVLVTDTYRRRCAVTGEKTLPVLEAAHIKPVATGGVHRVDNGILLRSDVHTLFDRGYVTISPDHRFLVSGRLRSDFDNGEHYHRLHGSTVWLPESEPERPSRGLLEWHADTVFLR